MPKPNGRLTSMQEAFCRHLTTGMTGAEAARAAGYAPKYANRQASQLLQQPHIQAEIERLNALLEDEAIADATEVQKFLTSVMRGEITEQLLTREGFLVDARATAKDRIRAAELLGRAQGMFTPTSTDDAAGELDAIAAALARVPEDDRPPPVLN